MISHEPDANEIPENPKLEAGKVMFSLDSTTVGVDDPSSNIGTVMVSVNVAPITLLIVPVIVQL